MTEKSKQRIDADKAFSKLQDPETTGDRALSASEVANQARDANTARLRELRLQKAAQEGEAVPYPAPRHAKTGNLIEAVHHAQVTRSTTARQSWLGLSEQFPGCR